MQAQVDELINISDPYDGYNRTLPASPFLPVVLASAGIPACSQGVESLGPKFGVTHHQVLAAAGQAVDLLPHEAAKQISDPAVAWAYVDQKQFNPRLHALIDLRTQIVKRPVLTTVEVLACPVRGQNKTHFVTGYVHKLYPRIYAMLSRAAGYDSALLIRGIEGGVVPSLRQAGKFYVYHKGDAEKAVDIDPSTPGIEQAVRAAPLPEAVSIPDDSGDVATARVDAPAAAKSAAKAGLAALEGESGPVYDSLVYSAAICLWQFGRCKSLEEAAMRVRKILNSGESLKRLT